MESSETELTSIIITVGKTVEGITENELRIIDPRSCVTDFSNFYSLATMDFLVVSRFKFIVQDRKLYYNNLVIIDFDSVKNEFDKLIKTDTSTTAQKRYCDLCDVKYYHRSTHNNSNLHQMLESVNTDPQNNVIKHILLSKEGTDDQPSTVLILKDDENDIKHHKIQFFSTTDLTLERVWFTNQSGFIHFHSEDGMMESYGSKRVITAKVGMKKEIKKNNYAPYTLTVTTEPRVGGTIQSLTLDYNINGIPHSTVLTIVVRKLYGSFVFGTALKKTSAVVYRPPLLDDPSDTLNSPNYLKPFPKITRQEKRLYDDMNHKAKRKVGTHETGRRLKILKSDNDPNNYNTKMNDLVKLEYLEYLRDLKVISSTFKRDDKLLTMNAPLENLSEANIRTNDTCVVCIDEAVLRGKVTLRDSNFCQIQITDEMPQHFNSNIAEVTPTIRLKSYQIGANMAMNWKLAQNFIFPEQTETPKTAPTSVEEYDMNLDDEQKTAVNKAIFCAPDLAFLIFGCAGSGKTLVLLQTIISLFRRGEKILFATPTNNNLNDFYGKITKIFNQLNLTPKIIKLVSSSCDISSTCQKICQFDSNGSHLLPKAKQILEADILLTTLQNSTRAIGMKIGQQILNFVATVIIIDEASFTDELTTLTPIISQLTANNIEKIKVILSGDPCQLNTTMRSKAAQAAKKDDIISRLLQRKVYKTNENTYQYLSKNYRMPVVMCQIANFGAYADFNITCKVQEMGELHIVHTDSEYYKIKTITESPYSLPDAVLSLRTAVEIQKETKEHTTILVVYKSMQSIILKLQKEKKAHQISVQTAEKMQGTASANIIICPCIYDVTEWQRDVRRITMMISRATKRLFIIGDTIQMTKLPVYRYMLQLAITRGSIQAPNKIMNTILNAV